jgi:tRNA/tmRNA/rRNA uracil-C5-methylase (TrmA/RlmC/RlmD family)
VLPALLPPLLLEPTLTIARNFHSRRAAELACNNPRHLYGQACPLLPIQSPIQHGYRNKCAFTLSADAAGLPTAGFRLSSFADTTAVAPPEGCPHVPLDVVAVAAAVTRVMRRGGLPVCNAIGYTGCWRTLTVRWAGSTRQVMVDVTIAPPPGAGTITWTESCAPLSRHRSSRRCHRRYLLPARRL